MHVCLVQFDSNSDEPVDVGRREHDPPAGREQFETAFDEGDREIGLRREAHAGAGAGDCPPQTQGVGAGMAQTGSTSTVLKSAGETISRYSMSGE